MKELKLKKSGFSESESYPVLKANFLKTLDSTLTPSEKREALEGFKEGFVAAQGDMPNWFEGMPPFLDPEYRIHPLMGHQVRSRHVFTAEPAAKKVSSGKAHQFTGLSPKEASPQYRDPAEPRYQEADYIGVSQYPVTLDPSIATRPDVEPDFSSDKYRGHRFDLEVLEFTYGFYSKGNRWVLYSPINHNRKRLSPRSRVLILRTIGMSPKKIASVEGVKYDTVKTWLRDLSGYPLMPATTHDWASGADEQGNRRVFSKHSPLDARHIKPQDSGSSDYDDKVDRKPDNLVSYRIEKRGVKPNKQTLSEGEKGLLKNIRGRRKHGK